MLDSDGVVGMAVEVKVAVVARELALNIPSTFPIFTHGHTQAASDARGRCTESAHTHGLTQ